MTEPPISTDKNSTPNMPHLQELCDYEYDFYDQLEDAALARLRDIDAMSEEETDDESTPSENQSTF